jgi:hypothetical protein
MSGLAGRNVSSRDKQFLSAKPPDDSSFVLCQPFILGHFGIKILGILGSLARPAPSLCTQLGCIRRPESGVSDLES